MEPISFLPAPGAPTDSEEQDLAEIDAAIELIRQGMAARVRLVGLRTPETVAGRRPRPCPGEPGRVQRRPRSQWRRRADHRAPTLGRRGPITPRRRRVPSGRDRAAAARLTVASGSRRKRRRISGTRVRARSPRTPGRERPGRADRPDARRGPAGSCSGGRSRATRRPSERLSIAKALAVFSSDNLSSVAYATEAIMFTLLAAGTAAFWLAIPISIVDRHRSSASSSSPTARRSAPTRTAAAATSWPARTSGQLAGLVAAAALLVDYVLTVSVSVAAGVAAITSAFPDAARRHPRPGRRPSASSLVMLVNLRGIRESGTVFAIPTYVFLVVDARR